MEMTLKLIKISLIAAVVFVVMIGLYAFHGSVSLLRNALFGKPVKHSTVRRPRQPVVPRLILVSEPSGIHPGRAAA